MFFYTGSQMFVLLSGFLNHGNGAEELHNFGDLCMYRHLHQAKEEPGQTPVPNPPLKQTCFKTNKQTSFSILLSCMEQIFGNLAHWGSKETGTKKVIGYHVWRKKRLRRMNSNRIQACRSRGLGGARAAPYFGRSVNPISSRKADMPNTLAPPDFQTSLRP